MNFDLTTLDSTFSTNSDVRRALEQGCPEGFAVLAREQTDGYGRRGRAWVSAPGGMYLSVLLQPQRALTDWPTLSLLAAVAALRAINQVAPAVLSVLRIKPPNDIVVGEEAERPLKLAGILPETHAGGVALGIGVNLNRPSAARVEQVDGKNTPVYLAELAAQYGRDAGEDEGDARERIGKHGERDVHGGREICPHEFALVFLTCFDECYTVWQEQGFESFEQEYRAVCVPSAPPQ